MEYIIIFISAILVNNIVLAKFLGICPFLGVSNRGFIHLAYQRRHGVATHHRMGNARLLQCPGGTKQSIAYLLHSVLHALQNVDVWGSFVVHTC